MTPPHIFFVSVCFYFVTIQPSHSLYRLVYNSLFLPFLQHSRSFCNEVILVSNRVQKHCHRRCFPSSPPLSIPFFFFVNVLLSRRTYFIHPPSRSSIRICPKFSEILGIFSPGVCALAFVFCV